MERLFTLPCIVHYQVVTIVRFYHRINSGIPLTSIPVLAMKLTYRCHGVLGIPYFRDPRPQIYVDMGTPVPKAT